MSPPSQHGPREPGNDTNITRVLSDRRVAAPSAISLLPVAQQAMVSLLECPAPEHHEVVGSVLLAEHEPEFPCRARAVAKRWTASLKARSRGLTRWAVLSSNTVGRRFTRCSLPLSESQTWTGALPHA